MTKSPYYDIPSCYRLKCLTGLVGLLSFLKGFLLIDIFAIACLIRRAEGYGGALSFEVLEMRHFFFSLNAGTKFYRLGSHRKLHLRDSSECIDALNRHLALWLFHRKGYELLRSLTLTLCVIHEGISIFRPTRLLREIADYGVLLTGFSAVYLKQKKLKHLTKKKTKTKLFYSLRRDNEIPFWSLINFPLLLQLHKCVINDIIRRLLHLRKTKRKKLFNSFERCWLTVWCNIHDDITNGLRQRCKLSLLDWSYNTIINVTCEVRTIFFVTC